MIRNSVRTLILGGIAAALLGGCAAMSGPPATFFITSVNPGKAGDLGGLAGADAWCEKLASAAGVGGRNWRAYLSTQGPGSVNARDRIGAGPWSNAKGVVIARNLAELHGTNNINKETALTEKGEVVPSRPDPQNWHDIMTGSKPDGTAMSADRDATCSNWSAGSGGGAMVGHHNRSGTGPDPVVSASWNSAHITPGCAMPNLQSTGGVGLYYCFAAK